MVHIVKVALGTLACNGIEACLGSDLPTGVQAALSDFVERVDAGRPPLRMPDGLPGSEASEPARSLDLPVDDRVWGVLESEAARQGATVSKLAAHSVLVYLAELDRLTPPDGAAIV
jgi:hypothetical protein